MSTLDMMGGVNMRNPLSGYMTYSTCTTCGRAYTGNYCAMCAQRQKEDWRITIDNSFNIIEPMVKERSKVLNLL